MLGKISGIRSPGPGEMLQLMCRQPTTNDGGLRSGSRNGAPSLQPTTCRYGKLPTACVIAVTTIVRDSAPGSSAIDAAVKERPDFEHEQTFPLPELAKEIPSRVEIMRLGVVSFPLMPHGLPPSTNTALAALDEFFSLDAFS